MLIFIYLILFFVILYYVTKAAVRNGINESHLFLQPQDEDEVDPDAIIAQAEENNSPDLRPMDSENCDD